MTSTMRSENSCGRSCEESCGWAERGDSQTWDLDDDQVPAEEGRLRDFTSFSWSDKSEAVVDVELNLLSGSHLGTECDASLVASKLSVLSSQFIAPSPWTSNLWRLPTSTSSGNSAISPTESSH